MTTEKKQEQSEIKRQSDDLLKLVLKKTGTSYRELVELSKRNFIVANLDVISDAERAQFSKLVLR